MHSDQHPHNHQPTWNAAQNGYFTPPQTANWSAPPPIPYNSAVPGGLPGHAQGAYSQQQQQQQMMMMMTMMHHMQNVPTPRPQIPSPAPVPAPESAKSSNSMNEQKIAQVLFQQTAKGATYKSAIETMHGVDGFAAYSWKDFYLERKERIDSLVEQLRQTSSRAQSQQKEVKQERSESIISEVQSASAFNAQRKSKEKSKVDHVSLSKVKKVSSKSKNQSGEEPSTSSRRTMNSLSVAPSNVLLAQVPASVAIDPHTELPAAPSERPTPPAVAQSKGHRGRGNAYTEDDTAFFFKLIAWELAHNDYATKGSICELLNELAPHHSTLSWKTFWSRHENVADKMMMLSELHEEDREEVIRTWKSGASAPGQGSAAKPGGRPSKKVSYVEDSDSEPEEKSVSAYSENNDNGDDDDDDDDAIGSTDDDEELGGSGSSFGPAEIRVIAKHIAATPGWFKGEKEWHSFTEKYPQRTAASWREFYRRRIKDVDEAARKYMKRAKRAERTTSISNQRGRPSWASNGTTRPPSKDNATQKRRHDEENLDHSGLKRSKHGNTD